MLCQSPKSNNTRWKYEKKKKRSAPFIHPPQDGHAHMCDHYRRISDQL